MPRFVILEHDWPSLHWDLMFEWGDVLRTWRLASPPPANGAVAATPLANHRKLYLDYEGPLSAQRGSVTRWDAGWYEVVQLAATQQRDFAAVLHGERFEGTAVLKRSGHDQWQFYFDAALSETGTTGGV